MDTATEGQQGLHVQTLLPGDIPIATTDLPAPALVVLAGPGYAEALADRRLTSTDIHRAMEAARALLAAQASPWWPQRILVTVSEAGVTPRVSFGETPVDTMPKDGAHGKAATAA